MLSPSYLEHEVNSEADDVDVLLGTLEGLIRSSGRVFDQKKTVGVGRLLNVIELNFDVHVAQRIPAQANCGGALSHVLTRLQSHNSWTQRPQRCRCRTVNVIDVELGENNIRQQLAKTIAAKNIPACGISERALADTPLGELRCQDDVVAVQRRANACERRLGALNQKCISGNRAKAETIRCADHGIKAAGVNRNTGLHMADS